jgi:hypothetical protein
MPRMERLGIWAPVLSAAFWACTHVGQPGDIPGLILIVWPEEALPFDPQVAHTDELRALAAETGATLAMGYNVMTAEGRRNEATVLAPDGAFLGVYGKEHPTYMLVADVPVGESNALQTRLGDWVGWLAL